MSNSNHNASDRRVLDPRTVLAQAILLLRASFPASIKINADYAAEIPILLAEEAELHELIMDLVTNAADSMPEGGEIRIGLDSFLGTDKPGRSSTTTSGEPALYLRLRISSPSTVISPDTQHQGLESELRQADSLAIVESLEGWMDVGSAFDNNSGIDIYLPALLSDEASLEDSATEDPELSRGHILALDDKPILTHLLQLHLTKMGFQVSTFTSSRDALASFLNQPEKYDMLITDNRMPVMTGLEVVQQVRAIRPELPVLFVTGSLNNGFESEISDMQRVKALRKPYATRQLEAVMDEFFGSN